LTLSAVELKRGRQISTDSRYAAPAATDQYLLPAPELRQNQLHVAATYWLSINQFNQFLFAQNVQRYT